MHYSHCLRLTCLIAALVMFVGCKSKQESPNTGTAASPTPVAPAQNNPAAKTASPQEMVATRAAAQRVLTQMEAGDFAAIYRESAASFKQIGNESAFVNKFQQTRMKTGVLKSPKEISFNTRPDNIHVTVYQVRNEHFISDIRLSFQRSNNGNLELAGLNQHDEPQK